METAIVAAMIQAAGLILAAIILAVGRATTSRHPATAPGAQPAPQPTAPPVQPSGPVRSLNGDVATPVVFRNNGRQSVKLFWMDYDGKPVLVTTIRPGDTARQNTFVTHPFLITDEAGGPLLLHYPDPQAITVNLRF